MHRVFSVLNYVPDVSVSSSSEENVVGLHGDICDMGV